MNAAASRLAFLNLDWGEIILILALLLILVGAKRLPDIWSGVRLGGREFWRSIRAARDEIDGTAHDAGKGVGGIYGKPAAEALTPDNKTAELYDPAAFRTNPKNRTFVWRW